MASASVCPRIATAAAAPALALESAGLTAPPATAEADVEHRAALLAEAPAAPVPPAPAPVPGVTGCSAVAAVLVAPPAAEAAPSVRGRAFLLSADAVRPHLLANSLFRPPRLR